VQWRVDGDNREAATSKFFEVVPVMGVWVVTFCCQYLIMNAGKMLNKIFLL